MNSYFIYILFSEKLNQYYTGSTLNIEKRLFKHNSGKSKQTPNTSSKDNFIRVWENDCLKNGVTFILNKGTNYEFIITPNSSIRVILTKSDSIVATNNTTSDRVTFTATQSGVYTLQIADLSLPIQEGFIEEYMLARAK